MRLAFLILAVAIGLAACGGISPVHVDRLRLSYARAPQPERVAEPLHVVVEPTFVPDTLRTTALENDIDVHGLRAFVRGDVREILAGFFTTVVVQESDGARTFQGYVAEVRLVRIDVTQDAGGGLLAFLDWSVVLRDGDSGEVVYSFSDRSTGAFSARLNDDEVPLAFQSALEAALLRLSADLRDRGVVATLRARAG